VINILIAVYKAKPKEDGTKKQHENCSIAYLSSEGVANIFVSGRSPDLFPIVAAFPIKEYQWLCSNVVLELTVSGKVQDLHLIPFSFTLK